jgi:hypothetical protein
MYEISVQKEFYALSKKFEYHSYNCVYDIIQNLFRSLVTIVLYFIPDVRWMIIVCLLVMLSGMLVTFEKLKGRDYVKK